MGPDDARAAACRRKVGCDRAAETLMRLRWYDRTDEALARGPDQHRQTENLEFSQPGQRRHALLRSLAEADPGVEHDIVVRNTCPVSDLERARKESGNILHDVDVGIDPVTVVHHDH